jgi:1,4-alpha-glucan branching enzyme
VDAHLASAGRPLGIYGDPVGDPTVHQSRGIPDGGAHRSPYLAYQVAHTRVVGSIAVMVRDPRSSMQVWSRFHGYPGDPAYLEFHKMRWPGGLKLWRVTGADVDLGAKEPYDPEAGRDRARAHARHFRGLLAELAAAEHYRRDGLIVAPFDTELFGHWWFEGVDFVADLYRYLASRGGPNPQTASRHLAAEPPAAAIALAQGSWGANGDFSMWLNPGTRWTWERIWSLEERFWRAASHAIRDPSCAAILEQAARQLLLMQSSDWQFVISTGAAADYATQRFQEHAERVDSLVTALEPGTAGRKSAVDSLIDEVRKQDDLFPDLLSTLAAVLDGS